MRQSRQAAGSGGRGAGGDKPPGDTPPQSLEAKGVGSVLPPENKFPRPVGLAIRVVAADIGDDMWAPRGVWARLPMLRLSGKGEK